MIDGLQPDSLLHLSEQAGVSVVQLRPVAVEPQNWRQVMTRLLTCLSQSPGGLVIDCRGLPHGAAEVVGPALYELLRAGRKRHPRVELTVVGQPDQTTGGGSAFLMPTRFETVEAASAALNSKQRGRSSDSFARGHVSDQPIQLDFQRSGFWQSPVGQGALAVLVLALVGSAVTYSALTSFARSVPVRRSDIAERATRVAVQGTVRASQGRAVYPDSGAVVLAWAMHQTTPKSKLVAAEALAAQGTDDDTAVVIAPTDLAGRYIIELRHLSHTAAPNQLLAVSKQRVRSSPPLEDDLKRLADKFADPQRLLGDHQYALLELFVDANVTKDQDFVLSDAGGAAAPKGQPPSDNDRPSDSESTIK